MYASYKLLGFKTMAVSIRNKGDRGFVSASVARFTAAGSKVFHFRADGEVAEKLGAIQLGDLSDFIRAAIAEKLDRDSIQSRDLS